MIAAAARARIGTSSQPACRGARRAAVSAPVPRRAPTRPPASARTRHREAHIRPADLHPVPPRPPQRRPPRERHVHRRRQMPRIRQPVRQHGRLEQPRIQLAHHLPRRDRRQIRRALMPALRPQCLPEREQHNRQPEQKRDHTQHQQRNLTAFPEMDPERAAQHGPPPSPGAFTAQHARATQPAREGNSSAHPARLALRTVSLAGSGAPGMSTRVAPGSYENCAVRRA